MLFYPNFEICSYLKNPLSLRYNQIINWENCSLYGICIMLLI